MSKVQQITCFFHDGLVSRRGVTIKQGLYEIHGVSPCNDHFAIKQEARSRALPFLDWSILFPEFEVKSVRCLHHMNGILGLCIQCWLPYTTPQCINVPDLVDP